MFPQSKGEGEGKQEARIGYLNLNSYAGKISQRVEILSETAKKVRVRAVSRTKLGGRQRWIKAGEEASVPAYAITPEPLGAVVSFGEGLSETSSPSAENYQ